MSHNQHRHHPANIGKVVCVGRNYVAHAQELGNDVPDTPMFFIKPASAVQYLADDKQINGVFDDVPRQRSYAVHYETELCVQMAQDVCRADVSQVRDRLQQGLLAGMTLGLDLTLRELQSELKEQGHPWERAKCFAGSCVLGDWLPIGLSGLDGLGKGTDDFGQMTYQLWIDDKLTQQGDTSLMIFDLAQLISDASYAFGLQAGDVLMTGTPSGVGALQAGQQLTMTLTDCAFDADVV